jgi:hypothetical protein
MWEGPVQPEREPPKEELGWNRGSSASRPE